MNAGLLFASFPCIDKNNDDKCDYNDRFTTVTYRFDIMHGGFQTHSPAKGKGWAVSALFPSQEATILGEPISH